MRSGIQWAVASRAVAAIVGGYVLTAITTFALALYLPLSKAEASMTATLLSFAIYTCIVIWVFATRTAWRAWAGVALPSLALGGWILSQRFLAAS